MGGAQTGAVLGAAQTGGVLGRPQTGAQVLGGTAPTFGILRRLQVMDFDGFLFLGFWHGWFSFYLGLFVICVGSLAPNNN